MGSEWRRVQITEVCQLIVDCVNKTAPTVEGPTPFKMIRTPNVRGGRVSTDDCRFVEKDTFTTWTRRADVRFNDVILTREAPLGEVGIIKSQESLFLGQRLMQYRVDPSVLDPDFLVYAFLSEDLQHQFRMHEGSGSVVSHIRVGDCSKFEISIPPLPEQTRIAGILATIDRKIELNRQMNTTLEAMAQALFQSWFVDFDPVIDNALAAGHPIPDELAARAERRKQLHERKGPSSSAPLAPDQPLPAAIQQQFPDRFVFTEALGWVPEGWGVGTLADIAVYVKEKINTSELSLDNYISTENMNAEKSGVCRAASLPNSVQVPQFLSGDTLISNIRPYFKKIWLSNFCGGRSNDILGLRAKNSAANEYLFNLLYQDTFFEYMTVTSKGTKMPRGDKVAVMGWPIVVPPPELMEEFSNIVKPSYLSNQLRSSQSVFLAETRDTLLPKLLSGQLRIPEAEQQVAEII